MGAASSAGTCGLKQKDSSDLSKDQLSIGQASSRIFTTILCFNAALFYGDGVITPAISVLSAVEGLEVAAPNLQPWVVPITIGVIISLCRLQKRGTRQIGALFGPVCAAWFITIAALGVLGVARHPAVLLAINPSYGVAFFLHNHAEAFFALLTVETLDTPLAEPVEPVEQCEGTTLGEGFIRLRLRFGFDFGEDPDVPSRLAQCSHDGPPFDMMDTTFFLSRETVVAGKQRHGMALWRDRLFAFMAHNALSATAFFQIPGNRRIELGSEVEI